VHPRTRAVRECGPEFSKKLFFFFFFKKKKHLFLLRKFYFLFVLLCFFHKAKRDEKKLEVSRNPMLPFEKEGRGKKKKTKRN
jgi:hypothetical protein